MIIWHILVNTVILINGQWRIQQIYVIIRMERETVTNWLVLEIPWVKRQIVVVLGFDIFYGMRRFLLIVDVVLLLVSVNNVDPDLVFAPIDIWSLALVFTFLIHKHIFRNLSWDPISLRFEFFYYAIAGKLDWRTNNFFYLLIFPCNITGQYCRLFLCSRWFCKVYWVLKVFSSLWLTASIIGLL